MKEIYIESSNEYKIDNNILIIRNNKFMENINLLNCSKNYYEKHKVHVIKNGYIPIGYRNILDIYPSFELCDNGYNIKLYFKTKGNLILKHLKIEKRRNEILFLHFQNYLYENKFTTFDLT
ncbi:hypothetical protein FACS1894172_07870 [Spirochaetia bacterium]|nr:hypothetical protein FACS1894164_06050 [Spirochaetia bacterium]GHU32001.1 hypothetical protein FACS1894172_07870 [Spirochaetia bacterium]